MFLFPQNKKVLYEIICNQSLPDHIKNETLLYHQMEQFYKTHDTTKPLIELNKSFLGSYVKLKQTRQELQEIKLSEFDSELQKHQSDFENTIILKKPKNIQFDEIKEDILDETSMEKEIRQKMEERQKEMDDILSQQKPIEGTPIESENKMVVKLAELQKSTNYEQVKKKVSFQEIQPESSDPKIDLVMLELTFIKQELSELKKMVGLLTTFVQSQSQ